MSDFPLYRDQTVIGYDEMLKENYKVRGCTEVVLPQARLERGLMEMFEPDCYKAGNSC